MKLLLLIVFILSPYDLTYAGVDIPGSKDHTLVSRFPGTHISQYSQKNFDEFLLPIGVMTGKRYPENKIDFTLSKFSQLKGKTTQITYQLWGTTSSYEVHTALENALKAENYNEIFSCSALECGDSYAWNLKYSSIANNEKQRRRYLVYKKNGTYISQYISEVAGLLFIQLDVVEVSEIAKNKVTVLNSSKLSDSLNKEGKVIVSGIYFDSGKSTIKDKSAIAIKNVADLLIKNKDLRLYIVGHTDNQGSQENNLILSQNRANAVLQYLVNNYKIDHKRLQSVGSGPYNPVSSNDTNLGKSKNRRVELVKI